MLEDRVLKQLITAAISVREMAYAPYSKYKVGAAVLTEDLNIFAGCNIENASYGLSMCAERTAIFKAVSSHERKIKALCVAGAKEDVPLIPDKFHSDDLAYPCGACRQVIAEFADSNTEIYVVESMDKYKMYKLKDLLPHTFKL